MSLIFLTKVEENMFGIFSKKSNEAIQQSQPKEKKIENTSKLGEHTVSQETKTCSFQCVIDTIAVIWNKICELITYAYEWIKSYLVDKGSSERVLQTIINADSSKKGIVKYPYNGKVYEMEIMNLGSNVYMHKGKEARLPTDIITISCNEAPADLQKEINTKAKDKCVIWTMNKEEWVHLPNS